MLNEHQVKHTYREYTREPLNEAELRAVLRKLGVGPHEVLRTRDATKAGIASDISADALIAQMVTNPRLLQRPIGIVGERAAIGRPPEALLSLLDD